MTQHGYALTRIDRGYTPIIPDTEITADIDHITWAHIADHSAVKFNFSDQRIKEAPKTKKHYVVPLLEDAIYDKTLRDSI